MSRVLVVGMGYLGTAVAQWAETSGWGVARASLEVGEGIIPVDLGVRDSVLALAEMAGQVEAVIHCASSSRGGEDAYLRVFVEGCRHLAEAFPASRLVFCSSCSVYPQQKGEVVTEDSPVSALSGTAKLLLEAEKIILEAGGYVARLSNLYGPGRSVLITRLYEGTAVLEEKGKRIHNHIQRDDAAAALMILAKGQAAPGIYNVTDSLPLVQKKMYKALCWLLQKAPPTPGPRRDTGKRPWSSKAVSNEKMLATGWSPEYPSFLDAVPDLLPTLPNLLMEPEDSENE